MISTNSLKEQLEKWHFKTPIKPLSRGVDFNIFYPGGKTKLTKYKTPIALYVGRIAIEKNLETFLDMPWDGTKIIVGDGPIRNELEKKHPNAIFTGKKTGKELADYYRSSDVFVFPSKTDTFGIVLIEALACGLPIAAYNVMGPKDIITSDALGILDDDIARAAKAALIKADPKFCVEHVKKTYSWETAGEQFIDAL